MKKYKWAIISLVAILFLAVGTESAMAYEENYTVEYYLRAQQRSDGQTDNYLFAPAETFKPNMKITYNTNSISITYSNNSAVLTRQKGGSSYWTIGSFWEISDSTFNWMVSSNVTSSVWVLFQGDSGCDGALKGSGGENSVIRDSKTITFGNANFSGLTPNSIYSLGTMHKGWFLGTEFFGNMDYVGTDSELTVPYARFILKITPFNFSPIETTEYDGGWQTNYYKTFTVYTEAVTPILSATDIKDTKATLNWSAPGNPSNTVYVIQRKLGGGEWQTLYTGSLMTYTDTGLMNETTYQYRVIAKHISGNTSRDKTCFQNDKYYIDVTTTANPAIAAAQEAALKASAAEQAAKDTLQYSSDAKEAAVQAQETANSVLSQVNHSTYGLEAIYNKMDTNTLPDIKKVYNPQGATATNTSSYEVKINATGIKSNLRYRVTCDGFDSGWTDSNTISISALTIPGVKTATVMVSNNPINPDQGAIAEDSIRFFKL